MTPLHLEISHSGTRRNRVLTVFVKVHAADTEEAITEIVQTVERTLRTDIEARRIVTRRRKLGIRT